MIGRLRRIRLHGATVAGLRFENARCGLSWPPGGLNYPKAIWDRDRRLTALTDALQDLLCLYAGPVDGATAAFVSEMEALIRQTLAGRQGKES